MALLSKIVCEGCGQNKEVMHPASQFPPKVCNECKEKERLADRKLHFQKLDDLTIEARVRRIEEWIYDYKPPVSLRDIKFG